MSQETGRGEISARIAFGAISLRQSERLSDEDTVRYIQENPYVQYYLGLHEFHMEPLFDPSMMVHFRKRFPIEFIAKVNEYICTGKWPEDIRKVDRNDDEPGKGSGGSGSETSSVEANTAPNSGTLIMDATVAGADIKYPTDIDLLNQCREHRITGRKLDSRFSTSRNPKSGPRKSFILELDSSFCMISLKMSGAATVKTGISYERSWKGTGKRRCPSTIT